MIPTILFTLLVPLLVPFVRHEIITKDYILVVIIRSLIITNGQKVTKSVLHSLAASKKISNRFETGEQIKSCGCFEKYFEPVWTGEQIKTSINPFWNLGIREVGSILCIILSGFCIWVHNECLSWWVFSNERKKIK